mgnify:CR=1 FL=1
MFKPVSESIQKQLDNPKVKVIKLHGTIASALHVQRSVRFIGKAVLQAPILIEGGLQVVFDHTTLVVDGWDGQIGVIDDYDGRLTLQDVSLNYSNKLIKEYVVHANKGQDIGALIVSNAVNAFIDIINSQILTASLSASSLKITNSTVGTLFGPVSGFYGNTVELSHSIVSNFDLTGDVVVSDVTTNGDLRLYNLTSPAQVHNVSVSPVPTNPKTERMYPLQKSMMQIYRVVNRLDDSTKVVVNVLTISGEAIVSDILFNEGVDSLINQFGYGLALINQTDGDVSLINIDNNQLLEFISVTGGDLKIVGSVNEQIDALPSGKISHIATAGEKNNVEQEDSALSKLNAMIGLGSVKTQVKKIIASATMRKRRGQPMPALHMVFSGNAGTGKTTVADIVGDALFENGVIRTSKVVKATKKDLVAGYVGQTAEKTRKTIEKAYGGVLFIDEAYTLTSDSSSNGFEAEAIGELIAQMENHRDDLIVILAGYTNEMKRFMESNQGLNSRFKTWIEFSDYNAIELTKIGIKLLSDAQMPLSKANVKWMHNAMSYFVTHQMNDGNGRFARNFTDLIVENHDTRLFDGDTETSLIKDDFTNAIKSIVKRTKI